MKKITVDDLSKIQKDQQVYKYPKTGEPKETYDLNASESIIPFYVTGLLFESMQLSTGAQGLGLAFISTTQKSYEDLIDGTWWINE